MDVLQSTQFNAGEGVLLDTTLMGRVVRTRCSISSRIGLTASRGWPGSPLVCDHRARWSRMFSSSATSVGPSVAVKCPTASSRRGRAFGMRHANAGRWRECNTGRERRTGRSWEPQSVGGPRAHAGSRLCRACRQTRSARRRDTRPLSVTALWCSGSHS